MAEEPRGKRPKVWVIDAGDRVWLRKEPRVWRPFEPVIEATVLRIARAAGLEAPRSAVARWSAGEGVVHRGIVVRRFMRDAPGSSEELALGVDLIRGVDPSYNPERHEQHTVERIREAVAQTEKLRAGSHLLQPFADLVFFDAWVGNSDRHQENWGVVRQRDSARLAPVFDTAACLGAELPEGHELLANRDPVRLETYIARCNSGFGNGERLLKQREAVERFREWPEWQTSKRWLPTFRQLLEGPLPRYLASMPTRLFPEDRKAFALELLARRLEWLERAA
jgi:hypothetical protein